MTARAREGRGGGKGQLISMTEASFAAHERPCQVARRGGRRGEGETLTSDTIAVIITAATPLFFFLVTRRRSLTFLTSFFATNFKTCPQFLKMRDNSGHHFTAFSLFSFTCLVITILPLRPRPPDSSSASSPGVAQREERPLKRHGGADQRQQRQCAGSAAVAATGGAAVAQEEGAGIATCSNVR